jgi:hypothetical protein
MLFGQPWHLYLVVVGCFAIWKIGDLINNRSKPTLPEVPAEPELRSVKLFDGPLDGARDEIPEKFLKSVYLIPYVPKDEDERQEIGNIAGMTIYAQKVAVYQQAMDDNYVYRRDLTPEEFQTLQDTNTLPPEFDFGA